MRHGRTNASERPFLGTITVACIAMSLLAFAAADPKWLEFESADAIGAGVAFDVTVSAAAAEAGPHLLAASAR
jgi:hypothetical protein